MAGKTSPDVEHLQLIKIMRVNRGAGKELSFQFETDRYIAHRYYRPIFDLLNIGRYANSNFTVIRDARYYRPISVSVSRK